MLTVSPRSTTSAAASSARAAFARLSVMFGSLALAALIGSCAAKNQSAQPIAAASPQAVAAPADNGGPKVITDLSQVSSAEIVNPTATQAFASAPVAAPTPDMGSHAPGDQTPASLRRLFLNNPEAGRYSDTEAPHALERLLNAKAAKYPGFSRQMLAQLLKAMQVEEAKPDATKLELPSNLQPVILTAVMNNEGQLRALIFQQRSGVASVDTLVVKACKTALSASDPPADAQTKDGNYHLLIEAELSNYSTDREGTNSFITRLGLGIL